MTGEDARAEHAAPPDEAPWLVRTVWGFGLGSLFSDLGHEFVTSLMPGFLASLGVPPIGLGVVEGVSTFAMSVSAVVAGRSSDTTPNRTPLLIAGYTLTAVKALFALATGLPLVLLFRTVAWIGRGARGPARDTLIADTVPKSAWGRAYGFRESMDTVGAVVGPLAAALLIARVGYRPLFWWTLVPSALAALAIATLVREVRTRPTKHEVARAAAPALPAPFRTFLVPATLFAVGNAAPTFLILRASHLLAARYPLHAQSIAIALYTVHNLCYAGGALPAGRVADRSGALRPLALGFALFALVDAGFSVGAAPLGYLGVLFILSGTATALVAALQSTVAAHLLPADVRGAGMGWLSGLTGAGSLVSGLLLGGLWTLVSARIAFAVMAAFAASGLLALLALLRVPKDARPR